MYDARIIEQGGNFVLCIPKNRTCILIQPRGADVRRNKYWFGERLSIIARRCKR